MVPACCSYSLSSGASWYHLKVNAWRKLSYWLFPDTHSPYAECITCGQRRAKQRMVRSGSNWFCDEECELQHTIAMIAI